MATKKDKDIPIPTLEALKQWRGDKETRMIKKWPHIKLAWKDYYTVIFFHDLREIYHKMREMHDSDLCYQYIHKGLIDREKFEKVMKQIGEWADICNSKNGDTGRDHYIIDVK